MNKENVWMELKMKIVESSVVFKVDNLVLLRYILSSLNGGISVISVNIIVNL